MCEKMLSLGLSGRFLIWLLRKGNGNRVGALSQLFWCCCLGLFVCMVKLSSFLLARRITTCPPGRACQSFTTFSSAFETSI